ncbi:PhnM protein [Pseudomonas grimontii]|nr:PhnM protein [Pseudomonas sp. B14(2022)]
MAAAGLAAEGLLDILSSAGKIAIGLRADLVQARSREGLPVVQHVWRQVKRVF